MEYIENEISKLIAQYNIVLKKFQKEKNNHQELSQYHRKLVMKNKSLDIQKKDIKRRYNSIHYKKFIHVMVFTVVAIISILTATVMNVFLPILPSLAIPTLICGVSGHFLKKNYNRVTKKNKKILHSYMNTQKAKISNKNIHSLITKILKEKAKNKSEMDEIQTLLQESQSVITHLNNKLMIIQNDINTQKGILEKLKLKERQRLKEQSKIDLINSGGVIGFRKGQSVIILSRNSQEEKQKKLI